MSPIIDLQKRLVEVGRIRMGKKSERGAPQKLETFRVTSRDQARVDEIAAVYGGTVQPWADRPGEFEVVTTTSELPILLLPGQALSQWYELWSAGGAQRRCDGDRDVISDGPCVCDTEKGDRKCKPTTRLSVMLPEIPGLGVWRLESHGYYAAVELSATAGMLEQATARGQMFPARLRIDQRSQVKDGKTTRYAVPVIDIDVRFHDALAGMGNGQQPALEAVPDYKPLPAAGQTGGVSVQEGLDAAARQSEPKTQTARSAAPIGAVADFSQDTPVPVPDDDGATPSAPELATSSTKSEAPAEGNDAEAGADDTPKGDRTEPQAKKLNVLVGKLRDAGHITTEQLYAALARSRSLDADVMTDLVGGRDADGELHWAPLRDSLTKGEASDLIERLAELEEKKAA